MTDLIDVAVDVQMILQNLGWRFTFIGGLAVQQWGEPRLTRYVPRRVDGGAAGIGRDHGGLALNAAPRAQDRVLRYVAQNAA